MKTNSILNMKFRFFYYAGIFFFVLWSALFFSTHSFAQEAQSNNEEKRLEQTILEGGEFLYTNKPQEAIGKFDEVISYYEEVRKGKKELFYCARSNTESLLYLLEAANNKQDAIVLSYLCADAHYYKAYALVELGRMNDAKETLQAGIKLAPQNARLLSELGHIFQVEKNWQAALETFKRAEQAAEFSPEALKNNELARAWRGIGFVLVELNQLNEAESYYKKCLKLNPQDDKAIGELKYIESLKQK